MQSQLQLTLGKQWATTWSALFITGLTYRDKQPLTSTGELKSTVRLTCMSLDCQTKPEYLEGPHSHKERTSKLYTGNISANHCTAMPKTILKKEKKIFMNQAAALTWAALQSRYNWTVWNCGKQYIFFTCFFHLTTAMWDKWFFGWKNEDLLSNLHFSFAVTSFAA